MTSFSAAAAAAATVAVAVLITAQTHGTPSANAIMLPARRQS